MSSESDALFLSLRGRKKAVSYPVRGKFYPVLKDQSNLNYRFNGKLCLPLDTKSTINE